ncbi:hypothetical protein NP493_369g04005 [Ridgeia piscesae]|uniref:Uncharacterized protein n=1 Tax=Ridgeia piscesae TaxID=27915 RepID=A0AAD9NTQ6_RIDPI|nr:hypothetical protein NP493_369g04005 [Ridgeia piscesae]
MNRDNSELAMDVPGDHFIFAACSILLSLHHVNSLLTHLCMNACVKCCSFKCTCNIFLPMLALLRDTFQHNVVVIVCMWSILLVQHTRVVLLLSVFALTNVVHHKFTGCTFIQRL